MYWYAFLPYQISLNVRCSDVCAILSASYFLYLLSGALIRITLLIAAEHTIESVYGGTTNPLTANTAGYRLLLVLGNVNQQTALF
jgi:hypothetical protein